jgi:glycosyltransferase involved in cell wall biosynthesis
VIYYQATLNSLFNYIMNNHPFDQLNRKGWHKWSWSCYCYYVKIIQIIARDNRGGTARWLEQLVPGLREQGHEVILLAGNVQEGEVEDPSFGALGGIRIQGLGRSLSIFGDLIAFWKIRNFIRKCKPDLINTHTAKAGALGRLATASLFGNRPTVVHTYHGHLLYGYFSGWKTKAVIRIERLLSRFTDFYIAAGETVKNDLLSVGIGTKDSYQIVRPGVPRFDPVNKELARNDFGLRNEKIVVGWLGRLTQIKRPDRVMDMARQFPDVDFLIGGEGELRVHLELLAPTNVRFLGWTVPKDIWSASDIALLTSDNEAQPISLIEASYASLPIVAQNVGSVAEVVVDKETGFLVSNLDEMANSLRALIINPELRLDFGDRANLFAQSRFSTQQFIADHLAAYRRADLLSGKG